MPKLETVRFVAKAIILQKKRWQGMSLPSSYLYIQAIAHA